MKHDVPFVAQSAAESALIRQFDLMLAAAPDEDSRQFLTLQRAVLLPYLDWLGAARRILPSEKIGKITAEAMGALGGAFLIQVGRENDPTTIKIIAEAAHRFMVENPPRPLAKVRQTNA